MKLQINFLKNLYLVITVFLFGLTVATPILIKSGVAIVREDFVEALLIAVISALAYLLFWFYKKETDKIRKKLSQIENEKRKVEDRLNDAFKYIGGVNVQINTIKTLFAELKEYPQNKQEMKQVMKFLANKILSIIPVDWVLLRIVDLNSQKILREYLETRGSVALIKYEISNKDLIEEKTSNDYKYVVSLQNTLNIKTFCVFPKIKIDNEQLVMLQAAVNQLEMLFLIFNSRFYKHREDADKNK